jgi:DNA-directed RNA polymerase subunit RPC12/RpoP
LSTMKLDKWSCLERAQELLARNDDKLLRYACLELRFCIEAITYEKLNVYSGYVPAKVFEKWQPNHALKMLLQFEPDADENLSFCISPESEPGKPTGNWMNLGEYRTFKLSWLSKNYNKLGNYLHVNLNEDREPVEIRQELQKIASELEPIINSDIIAPTLANRIQFKCQACGHLSVSNDIVLRQTKHAICIDPNCGAEYDVTEEPNGRWKFKLIAIEFKCLNCGQSNWLENRELDIGRRFKCRSCGEHHVVVNRQWGYVRQSKLKGDDKENTPV